MIIYTNHNDPDDPKYGQITQITVDDPPAPPPAPPDPYLTALNTLQANLQAQITALAGAISPQAAQAVQGVPVTNIPTSS